MNEIIGLILLWNLFVFLLYGYDKLMAVLNKWRISEKMLILCSLFLGGIGAMLGMRCFRHKTKHNKFNVLVSIAFIITVALIFIILIRENF